MPSIRNVTINNEDYFEFPIMRNYSSMDLEISIVGPL